MALLRVLLFLSFFVFVSCGSDSSQPASLEDAIDQVEREQDLANINDGVSRRLDNEFDRKGANCSKFLNSAGEPGEYGRVIIQAFKEHEHLRVLLEAKSGLAHSMPQLCPRFKKFTTTERAYFWVWVFAAISWDESTCKPNERNPAGVNSAAVGLLQLEEPYRLRYWRGELCRAKSVRAPGHNLLCGMEIMRGQFEGRYSGGNCGGHKGLAMPCSYWQKLRQDWSAVHRLITLYPGCKR